MSLLLKALQKADEERNSAPATRTHELSLQPLDLASSPSKTHFHNAASSPAQAASMMAAANQRAGIADYVRERPLIVFGALAALFLTGYFAWVYLQLSPASRPSSASRASAPAASQPISVAPPLAMASLQPTSAATSASPGAVQTSAASSSQNNATLAVTRAATDEPPQPAPAARLVAGQSTPANNNEIRTRLTGDTAALEADAETHDRIAKRSPQPIAQPRVSSGHTIDVSRDTKPAEVNRELAAAYQALQEGRLADAESLYQKLANAEPRNADVLLGLAAIAVLQARPELASEFYFRVIEFDPKNPHAQAGLISTGGQADRLNAETRLKQLISREPTAFLHFVLGNLYADQANWAAAQAAYFQAHHLEPSHPDYAFNLAIGLEHLSQRKLAVDYYRRALALAAAKRHAGFDITRVSQHIADLAASEE